MRVLQIAIELVELLDDDILVAVERNQSRDDSLVAPIIVKRKLGLFDAPFQFVELGVEVFLRLVGRLRVQFNAALDKCARMSVRDSRREVGIGSRELESDELSIFDWLDLQ